MYGITTTKDAQDNYDAALAKVATADPHRLAGAVNAVQEAAGILALVTEYEQMTAWLDEQGTTGHERAYRTSMWLNKELVRGADDGWSGRGNDAARALFDGKKDAARDIMIEIDRRLKADLA